MNLVEVKDANGFADWLADAESGDVCVYHTGLLANARGQKGIQAGEIDMLANYAWAAYDKGKVSLVQRRIEPGICDYLAVRNA